MSVGRAGALVASVCLVASAVWLLAGPPRGRRPEQGWSVDAIRAKLERVVPVHNDVSFIYVLENLTDSAYSIERESDVSILGRSKSTGELLPKLDIHVSGEFPLVIPARRTTHFALVWTGDREMEPAQAIDAVRGLKLASFVVRDGGHHYQVEFPVSP